MSQPTYSFDPNANDRVAVEMTEANTRIRDELNLLNEELKATLKEWQSPESKVAYEQRQHRWNTAAASMPASLTYATSTLESITDAMIRTETNMRASWGMS